MKIEKVNDNQIRCTLTREDLASRELKISELAYGSEKAKNLFRDMMQQANFEFGFEAEDIPLMIEAIPMNAECIVLIITKVEDPDELDTRFSRFAPSVHDNEEEFEEMDEDIPENADEVMELFRRLHEHHKNPEDQAERVKKGQAKTSAENKNVTRVFRFDSLRAVVNVSKLFTTLQPIKSSLYKDSAKGKYILSMTQHRMKPEIFTLVCNTISEYGSIQKIQSSGLAYMSEHYEPLLIGNALSTLADV
ncbi:MAG: adaptor protein MecA [Lachnospiraceae bacterium]|nr:adaptor protein MecA [Lachnospiraceae bacterium]